MLRVGIVGHGSDKFTELGEQRARDLIFDLMAPADVLISGHSPMGGVDIWVEEAADLGVGVDIDLKIPEKHQWNPPGEYGYKARNIDIAKDSDEVHVIVVDEYPEGYTGMRFDFCYHCKSDDHVKSGGCWTGIQAEKMGKPVKWHVIRNV